MRENVICYFVWIELVPSSHQHILLVSGNKHGNVAKVKSGGSPCLATLYAVWCWTESLNSVLSFLSEQGNKVNESKATRQTMLQSSVELIGATSLEL